MDLPARRRRDTLLYGVGYPLVVVAVTLVAGGADPGRLLLVATAIGAFGTVLVLGFVGGPWAVRAAWRETPVDEPLPGAARQVVFLAVTAGLAGLLAVLL